MTNRGKKHLENVVKELERGNIQLKQELKGARNDILILESKLLNLDFSLKNCYLQKVKKKRIHEILELTIKKTNEHENKDSK